MGEIRRIVDILAEANATIDQMGTTAFVDALHRGDNAPALMEIKEALELGQFAELYNQTNTPKLIYAQANPPGSGRADFTVWDDTQNWSRDFEVTSLWEREDNFPQYTDEDDPDATHVELSLPRRTLDELLRELTKKIKRELYKHARRTHYPTYWLAVYTNFSREAYKVPPDYAAQVVTQALAAKPPSSNVERVWVWNPDLQLAYSTQNPG